jgi:Flp pilus assembly pilin Flp
MNKTPPQFANRARGRRRGEQGQSTVEYALLLLGAAAIALVLVAWVTKTDLIGRLFDTVVGRILNQAQ